MSRSGTLISVEKSIKSCSNGDTKTGVKISECFVMVSSSPVRRSTARCDATNYILQFQMREYFLLVVREHDHTRRNQATHL
jgi:hypothetical protein